MAFLFLSVDLILNFPAVIVDKLTSHSTSKHYTYKNKDMTGTGGNNGPDM
jgi:hypothetical protein